MESETEEYRTRFIKGSTYMILFYAGILTVFSIFIMFLIPNVWLFLIMLTPALALPFVIVLLKSHKVRFSKDFIETSNLFGNKRLNYNEVKKYGIFISSTYEGIKLTSEYNMGEVDDDELLFHHIYLTTNEEFDLWDFRPKRHLKFPYRKQLFQRLQDEMSRF